MLTRRLAAASILVACASLASSRARAQEAGLEPLSQAFAAGRAFTAMPNGTLPPGVPVPTPLMTPAKGGPDDAIFTVLDASTLPPPDAQTLKWLSSRIPNLDAASVRAVPFASADSVMRQAVAAKATYLDVLSHQHFRGKEIYYLSQSVLGQLNLKYISGTVPVSGNDENGKPFQMQGFVIGQGRVEILYDRADFTFKDDGHRWKIQNGGRVESTIQGAGDVGIDGLSVDTGVFLCRWAKIQRMTKESMYKIKVQTSCGSRGGNDISPVRVR